MRLRAVNAVCLTILVAVLLSWPGFAADPASGISIEGQVRQPKRLTVSDLKQMPSAQIDVTLEIKGTAEKATYVGVTLLSLINNADVIDGDGKGARLRRVIEVSGRDGYTVAIAMGEIEPNLEGKPVLLAYLRNGKPVEPVGTVRLVVPGDRHGSRSVRDAATITVK